MYEFECNCCNMMLYSRNYRFVLKHKYDMHILIQVEVLDHLDHRYAENPFEMVKDTYPEHKLAQG